MPYVASPGIKGVIFTFHFFAVSGLYKVDRYWYTTGLAGFGVYKFALRRLKDQAPPPWTYEGQSEAGDSQDSGVVSDVASDAGSTVESELRDST